MSCYEGRFAGKVAIVTGGFSGIGKATVMRLASEGAKVIATDLNANAQAEVDREFKEAGLEVVTVIADQSSKEDWEKVVGLAKEKFGALHILVNNAGMNIRYQLSEMDLGDWERSLAVNLTGPMLGMYTALPLLRESGGGSIVNTGSIAGVCGHPTTAYSAAKWGLRGLSKSAAFEFGDYNVRVNCVHPGATVSGIIDRDGPAFQALIANCPQRRPGYAEELASAICYLASDEASRITGIDMNVDGGSAECGSYWAVWETSKRLAAEQGKSHRT
ncbi:MAG: SDR family oxidoreductase [Lachnospiraceae bacterium]|nr:SDR family oxidoreductase [Lachnospiraceae bacterium]